jgi:8-oxo-dGTP diphosphatase
VDRGFQLAYVCAYRVMRVYWSLRHPETHGSLVTLWHRGEVLLIRNSYLRYYCLPGGYVRRGETARHAALRELSEEVGVSGDEGALDLLVDETSDWAGKRDHVVIFALEVPERPVIHVDHREVVDASWWTPAAALELELFPPARKAIQRWSDRPRA